MNLQQEIELKHLNHFFDWWFSELKFMLPAVIRNYFFKAQIQLVFEWVDEQLKVTQYLEQTGEKQVKTFPLTPSGYQKYQDWLSTVSAGKVLNCIFKLNAGQAIEKIVEVPTAAKTHIKELLGYEISRITPFTREQIYYDAQIVSAPKETVVKAYWVAVPRAILDPALERLQGWHIPVKQVCYTDSSLVTKEIALQCNMFPERRKIPKVRNWQTYSQSGLFALVFFLLVTILFFPMLSQQYALKQVKQNVNSYQKMIRKLNNEQSSIKTKVVHNNQLIAKKKTMPDLLAVLTELTTRLDDQTYLVSFDLTGTELRIEGHSASASSLIATLEASTMLKDVHFSSSVKQNKRTGLERFQIKMTVLTT